MRNNRRSIGAFATLAALTLTAFVWNIPVADAQTEMPLWNFSESGTLGYGPAGVIMDSTGNIYGATPNGGPDGGGVVFELMPKPTGGWQPKVLHAFNTTDGGFFPSALIFGGSGILYGVTSGGGANSDGTVFEMVEGPGGNWGERTLYNFTDLYPSGLTLDTAGNIYGTVAYGHGSGSVAGYVYKLTHGTGGSWTESVLYDFGASGTDGYQPYSGVTFDSAGNLYGTTFYGGSVCNCGTVWELSPAAGGTWTETILHNFADDTSDGGHPLAGVTFDSAGNLYGTTFNGGGGSLGIVYELTPAAGSWTETLLHSFFNNGDGIIPGGGRLVPDASGNLYDTTQEGGSGGNGTIYKLTQETGGSWRYATYFRFDGTDGASPSGGVVFDAHGNLYGATPGGGSTGNGVVYEIKP